MVTVGVFIVYNDVNLHYSIVGTHTGRYLTLQDSWGARERAIKRARVWE